MEKYGRQDNTFSTTREAKFIFALTDAIEGSDKGAFTTAVYDYDQVS